MIVYREDRVPLHTANTLAALRCKARRLATGNGDHELIRDLLIEFGQLEGGLADELSPVCEVLDPRLTELRNTSLALGRLFFRSWRGLACPESLIQQLDELLSRVSSLTFPAEIRVAQLEGYAYYGLFPETFAAAAERFFNQTRPGHTVCIGIRSIGTSLSAAVAGAIAECGGSVDTWTVRPRGHPFDRQVKFSGAIRSALLNDHRSHYLIVDEGPGLSGSSFSSVAGALSEIGIPDSRIVFFPSWDPDASALISESARGRWNRHPRTVGDFDSEMVQSGWMERVFGRGPWCDMSAGRWREFCYAEPSEFPAVQPQHERRKFVRFTSPPVLAKFVGFGSRGQGCFERARMLAEAGFAPTPFEVTQGFLLSSFVAGTQATWRARSEELVGWMAGYLAHIRRELPATVPVPWDELFRMVLVNVEEALGRDWMARAERIVRLREVVEDGRTYRLDGRMLPHEWIQTERGFLKTDVLDHNDDHFFPGPQDIAWDVAGIVAEFGFDQSETEGFIDRYARATGDIDIRRRLPFYRVAYPAFRLAYSRLAENSIVGPDRDRFRRLASHYSATLRRGVSLL